MQNLREFFASSSGLVPARQGLALGWVISALTWIAVLLGGKEAAAEGQGHRCRIVDCKPDSNCPSITPIGCYDICGNWWCTT